jgi:uncharacterized protein
MEIYLIIGAFAGITSGLLGIGGGVIIVPALASVFAHSTLIPKNYMMHVAIGTSLASMTLTTLSGSIIHYQRRAIRWDILQQVWPLLVIGVLIGALIAIFLPSTYLKIVFSLFLTFFSLRLLFSRTSQKITSNLAKNTIKIFSFIIGALTSILGAGSGTMLVPFLLRLNANMHEALGTSLACGVLISTTATTFFILMNQGYIYWPAFWGIIISSVLFAPVGTTLAHKLSTKFLKRLFASFLLLIAIDMLVYNI